MRDDPEGNDKNANNIYEIEKTNNFECNESEGNTSLNNSNKLSDNAVSEKKRKTGKTNSVFPNYSEHGEPSKLGLYAVYVFLFCGQKNQGLLADISDEDEPERVENNVKTFLRTFSDKLPGNKNVVIVERNFDEVGFYSNAKDIGLNNNGCRYFLVFGVIFKKFAVIVQEYAKCYPLNGEKKVLYGPIRFRVSVVTAAMFEEAMGQSVVETVQLTYTTVFPGDCRMFYLVPIYRDGYIHQKDRLWS